MAHLVIVVQYETETDSELRRWESIFIGSAEDADAEACRQAMRLRELGFGGIDDWYAKPL